MMFSQSSTSHFRDVFSLLDSHSISINIKKSTILVKKWTGTHPQCVCVFVLSNNDDSVRWMGLFPNKGQRDRGDKKVFAITSPLCSSLFRSLLSISLISISPFSIWHPCRVDGGFAYMAALTTRTLLHVTT